MSIKGFEMLRKHMSYYDFDPDSVLLLGNVLYYLKQAEGEVAELESENKKLRELVRHLYTCMERQEPDGSLLCANCPYENESNECDYEQRMEEMEVDV